MLEIISTAVFTAAKVSAPILLTSLAVGLFMGVVQSVTQIQEQSLAFVPKFIAVGGVVLIAGSWMLAEMVTFTELLISLGADLVR